jgi:cytochrome c biogenesis protein CcmG/thiol:disulfide interchange protein DsbE
VTRFLAALGALLVAGLVGLFALTLTRHEDPTFVPSAIIGKAAPAFSLPPLQGRAGPELGLSLADLKSGRISVVNFWASWCTPCRIEHPLLARLAARGDVILYGVNYKDRPDEALGFLIELGDPYERVGRDATGRTAIDWGVYGVPETFVVDGAGNVLARLANPLNEQNLVQVIEPAIRAAAKN